MPGPATRVLAVLELLQAHGRISGAELAHRLEVDRRTVRRYIAVLEEMGIPITADRGRDGGYMLVAGFKLPPMMFDDDEALALSVGLIAARGLGLAEGTPAIASAQAKLERVMPTSLKRRVRAVDETVSLDLLRPALDDAAARAQDRALVALSSAAQSETRVHMTYRTTRDQSTERDFDPYGLAYRRGHWYAVGMCHLRRGMRSFRLDRVGSVLALATRFARPAGFDALAHLVFSVATLPRAHAVEVLLRTDLATARRELFPTACVLAWAGDGVLLLGQTEDLRWFALELSRLPFAFEIRRPAALRSALAEHAEALLGLALAGRAQART